MMGNLAPLVGTTALLTALAASLILVADQHRPDEPAAPLASVGLPSDDNGAVTISIPAQRPDVYYAAITERPLFAPTRRPFVPEIVSAEVADPEPQVIAEPIREPDAEPEQPIPEFRLLGLMTTDKGGQALIAVGDTAATWFANGQDLMGWQIGGMTHNGLTLTKNDIVLTLEIYSQ